MPEAKTVYKYPLSMDKPTEVVLPVSLYKPVHFGLQKTDEYDPSLQTTIYRKVPTVWVEQWLPEKDEQFRTEKVVFEIFGTGHHIPVGALHIGSVIDGGFVWHLYQTSSSLPPLQI